MIDRTGRTVIVSTVFIDIVGYSKSSVSRQMAMKARLNEHISNAMARLSAEERIILDTGDGAALCFLGDPEDALFVATAVGDAVRKETGEGAQTLRTGIHLGPVKLVIDLNGQENVLGDGINVAQRIMSFAGDDEILASRAYYEVVARLDAGNEKLFSYLGTKKDKHVREHQVYAFSLHAIEPGKPPAQDSEHRPVDPVTVEPEGRTADVGTARLLTEDELAAEERRLADRIGPLANVIVRRASRSTQTIGDFYKTISAAIPDEADRAAFLADAPIHDADAEPAARGEPPPRSSTDEREEFRAEDLQTVEKRLAEHIGPLAGVLVRKAALEATDLRDLYAKLAAHITRAPDRERFLASLPGHR